MAPRNWYTQRIDETLRQLSQTKTQINRISLLRVLLFVAGIAGLILFYRAGTWAVVLTVCCTFLPFFILVKVHNRLYFRKERLETQLQLNQNELKGLEGDYSAFDEGREFINPGHPYSYDLDLFGRKSLFQALGRTCTHIGKQTLAAWMQHHLTEKTAIETRQESIRDMRTPLVGKALPLGCTRHQYPAARTWIAAYPFAQLVRNDVYRLRHPQLRTYPAGHPDTRKLRKETESPKPLCQTDNPCQRRNVASSCLA